VIGEVGVRPVDGDLELGWWVLPAHRRRGNAAAMVGSFTAWVAQAMPGRTLTARIPPGHVGSERVAEAAGLVRAGTVGGYARWERRDGLE
jgi:RimJ/RimL family protein N-acetyltransferase